MAQLAQLNKLVLLCLGGVLLVAMAGCGSSSSTAPTAPNGFLYAANSFRPGSMAAFSLTSGGLGHLTNSPFATTGNAPYTIAAAPPAVAGSTSTTAAKFLYAGIPATSKGGVITRVLGRTLSGSVTGGILLLPIKRDHTLDTPQVFASGGDYDPLAVTPTGNFLYAIDLTSNHLDAFAIDSSNGTLTAKGSQGPPAVGPDLFSVVIDPQGKFVFAANCDCVTNPQNQGSVSAFSINGDGTLTAVPGSPFHLGTAAGNARPIALAVSPDSRLLFVASLAESPGTADEVYVESIAANGALSDAVPGAAAVDLPVGSMPVSITVSTDGNYVYTGNAGNHTVSFFINNCTQSPCTASAPLAVPSTNSTTPVSGTVGVILTDPTNPPPSSTTTTSVAGFLYVTDYDHGTVQAYSITSPDGCSGVTNCVPGILTGRGSAVNTGGANPFGLAIAY